MPHNLVIVESPAKAKTIGRFLGRNYTVKASMGHIRDLPEGTMGIDVENRFAPKYVIPKEKKALIKELNEAAAEAGTIFLATDPDREGEAIAWHLTHAIDIDKKTVRRVVFHEITEPAINEAFKHPRDINEDLVNAQQTRRILDRIVGYRLSPFLWKKLRGGLSAGRVQSAALRMVVDREKEIEVFVPQEYWRILASLAKAQASGESKRTVFKALLHSRKGHKGKLDVTAKAQADAILQDIAGAAYRVSKVQQRESQRKPTAPFTTSTLQQEAWRKLRYPARKTMSVAQQLYEGISLGSEGAVGLITYMRTDSPVVSEVAIQETRDYIRKRFGADALPHSHRVFTAKSKLAQEAHEAIRPTSVFREPSQVKTHLNNDQFRLYDLVWKRMVASQMHNAMFDATTVQIEAAAPAAPHAYIFEAKGLVQKNAGFLALYSEGKDTDDDEDEGALPPMQEGELLDFLGIDPQQKFTQPPPRYTEATLVKALEENGIGRPSTYAPTIATIQERGYVSKDKGILAPQQIGRMVTDLLQQSYGEILDLGFTARMEEGLDEIARGEKPWVPFLSEFYAPFDEAVKVATLTAVKMDESAGENCELCGKPMVIKKSRFGLFMACSGYPECFRINKLGKKVGNTKPIVNKVAGVKCPEDGGDLLQRRSRAGKTFYGCANYKSDGTGCKFATSLRPVVEPCPTCGSLLTAFPRGGVVCVKGDYKGRMPRPKRKDDDDSDPDELPSETTSEAPVPVAVP
ncbi:MAG: type I DNA topoisomerase [Dehalococcoidia bacterium]|nr:type I DNA topoisomerase [Dehalococcoidia bacterium]